MKTLFPTSFARGAATGAFLGLALLAGDVSAATVEGVRFPERLQVAGSEMSLRGAALLRYKVFFKAYVAAFYADPAADAASLENAGRRLEIEYFWPIPAEGFAEATREGIARNVDPATYASLRGRIERLSALYRPVSPGDRYSLTYLPGRGTELAHNGTPLGVIEGEDFASAVFAIWLGEDPLDAKLKRDLLGRS